MGIPRFYRWLKERYPQISVSLNDPDMQMPHIDCLHLDLNALIYRCLKESGCFLREKIKPLSNTDIMSRVLLYILNLVGTVKPRSLLFIALDGVAPRAKINQSRDRRFKAGLETVDYAGFLKKLQVEDKENFKTSSISPGTDFLYQMSQYLRGKISMLVQSEWNHLKVVYSDCNVPGEGEHKIMDFLRESKANGMFDGPVTHCIYSPDADLILLALSLECQNLCLIKQDTFSSSSKQSWCATYANRSPQPPKFELVLINIVRTYLTLEFCPTIEPSKVSPQKVQQLLDDFILLLAFVGNDFLPVEFCFVLNINHMENLLNSYKNYLAAGKPPVNKRGQIDWSNMDALLEEAKKYQLQMLAETRKQHQQRRAPEEDHFEEEPEQNEEDEDDRWTLEAQPESVNGRIKYYETRFNITSLTDGRLDQLIEKYLQGLAFYCVYYFKGLPSWSWFYPYHYTPLLIDVHNYVQTHKLKLTFAPSEPFDPLMALMFMMPLTSCNLLPNVIHEKLQDAQCPLRQPIDYYPPKFKLDPFQKTSYKKGALIPFLDEAQVSLVYKAIPLQAYSPLEKQRNERGKPIIFSFENSMMRTIQQDLPIGQPALLKKKLGLKVTEDMVRFPQLCNNVKFDCVAGKITVKHAYKHQGSPNELVYFNHFLGYIESKNPCTEEMKEAFLTLYKKIGITGPCTDYYIIKRARKVRGQSRINVARLRREVIVPDFAVFTPPRYSYLSRIEEIDRTKLLKLDDRAAVLGSIHFGCTGIISAIARDTVTITLQQGQLQAVEKICDSQQNFYSLSHVQNELHVAPDTLLSLISDVVIPILVPRKKKTEYLPDSLNFGLRLVDLEQKTVAAKYARCGKDGDFSKNIELSETALLALKKYIQDYEWLVELIEQIVHSNPLNLKRALREFGKQKSIVWLCKQFIKMYDFQLEGHFHSPYSKTAQFIHKLQRQKPPQDKITVPFSEVFTVAMSYVAPPYLSEEPDYHSVGDRVILLSNLESGFITSVDDSMIHLALGESKLFKRVAFGDVFNEKWAHLLAKGDGPCWNREPSLWNPEFWNKVVK